MQRLLESGETRFAETEEEEEEDLLLKLDDYLNFFEFITFLVIQARLKQHEALAMFDYPLRLIASDNAVMRYPTRPEYGYEGLPEFVKKLSYPGAMEKGLDKIFVYGTPRRGFALHTELQKLARVT